jgi:FkbM family methyltransferase
VEGLKEELKEVNKIIFWDLYKTDYFKNGDLDFVFDVGANIGVFALFMRMRHPSAKIICVEPGQEVLPRLKQNIKNLNIDLIEKALGDGSKFWAKQRYKNSSVSTVFDKKTQSDSYLVQSITLSTLFHIIGCTPEDNFFVKLDCEGGEKYLVGDYNSETILKHANQISLEIHFKCGKTTDEYFLEWGDYNNWVYDLFGNSHSIEYYVSNKHRGYGHYCIKKTN